MTTAIPATVVVRLSEDQRAALGTIHASLSAPHRQPPSLSEAIRAAITTGADRLATFGTLAGLPV